MKRITVHRQREWRPFAWFAAGGEKRTILIHVRLTPKRSWEFRIDSFRNEWRREEGE